MSVDWMVTFFFPLCIQLKKIIGSLSSYFLHHRIQLQTLILTRYTIAAIFRSRVVWKVKLLGTILIKYFESINIYSTSFRHLIHVKRTMGKICWFLFIYSTLQVQCVVYMLSQQISSSVMHKFSKRVTLSTCLAGILWYLIPLLLRRAIVLDIWRRN